MPSDTYNRCLNINVKVHETSTYMHVYIDSCIPISFSIVLIAQLCRI